MNTKEVKQAYDHTVKHAFGGEYEYHRWHKSPILRAGFAMTKKTIEQLTDSLRINRAFELGPGAGTWSKLLLGRHQGMRLDAVDISTEMLNLARQNLKHYEGVTLTEADFLTYQPTSSYDFFFSIRALEYFVDKEPVIQKISSLLASGGRGLIITKIPRYARSALRGRVVSELHQYQIAPRELGALLQKAGCADIAVYPAVLNVPVIVSPLMSRVLYALLGHMRLNMVNAFFAESYAITFTKL